MINDLLKYHSYGAVIGKHGGEMWLFEYSQKQLFRIFEGVKYSSFWIDPVNNHIYIYL